MYDALICRCVGLNTVLKPDKTSIKRGQIIKEIRLTIRETEDQMGQKSIYISTTCFLLAFGPANKGTKAFTWEVLF